MQGCLRTWKETRAEAENGLEDAAQGEVTIRSVMLFSQI